VLGMDQAITRGFKPSNIAKIVKYGEAIPATGRYGSQLRFTLGGNAVIINSQGKIVTIFSNISGTRNRIGKGFMKP
jgi:hypothetical protein